MTQEIEISNLITNCQSREATYEDTVSEYAEAMREGEQFPAVIVYTDGNLFWLADGYHRTHAAMANGYKTIRAEIRQGSFRDAHKFSRKANKKNGRRLTNADKRYMVTDTWNKRGELGLGGNPSTSSLAQYCEVSEGFVRKLFNDGVITRPADAPRTGVDGRAYQYETTSYSTKSPLTAPPKIPNTAQISTFDFSTPPRVGKGRGVQPRSP